MMTPSKHPTPIDRKTQKEMTMSTKKAAKKSINNNGNSKKAPAKKAAKKMTEKQNAAVERNRIDQQLHIVKLVDANPRREGTFGYESFKKIKNGMTVEQFQKAGGRLKDLHWDISKFHVKLSKRA